MITVLVVDDSHSLRQMIVDILVKKGLKVFEAANGKEAQEQLNQQVPDLVITDLIMPEMNGYELCRWIKNNPSTKDIPVLICSTKSEEFDRHWGMKQGADAYLTKPFQATEMLQTIKFLLQNKRKNKQPQ